MVNRYTRGLACIVPLLLLAACSSQPVAPRKDASTQTLPQTDSTAEQDFDFAPRKNNRSEYLPGTQGQTFPRLPELEPQVAFWRNVYAHWGRSQVALHDDRHMGVVYEVVNLPGEVSGGFTPSQKALVQERFDYWKVRLRNLESKLASRAPLDTSDMQLARRIGEHVDVRLAVQGAAERLRYQRGLRERFKRGLEISGRYDRHFRQIFRNAGLPEELAFLPHVESSFQANARSSAGAIGIWQFTAGAAKTFMNGQDSVSARLDPIASAHGAARYLTHAYSKLGSWPLAVTSYNHGIGGMQKAKNSYGHNFERIVKDYDHPLFGFASRNYYAEFLAAAEIAKDPERFFPEGVDYESPQDHAPSPFTEARFAAASVRPPAPQHAAVRAAGSSHSHRLVAFKPYSGAIAKHSHSSSPASHHAAHAAKVKSSTHSASGKNADRLRLARLR